MEQKPKILPVYPFEMGKHRVFMQVDIDNRQFIKCGNNEHRISFDEMTYKGTHYEMKFDQYLERPPKEGQENEDTVTIKIPELRVIALAEMSEKYNIPAYELKYRTDFDIMVDPERFRIRDSGVLPVISLLNQDYKIDMHDLVFRSPNRVISMCHFVADNEPYGERSAYMDLNSYQVFKIDLKNLKEMPPDNIVKVVIPSFHKLDPYYDSKLSGIDFKISLMANPIPEKLTAKIIPVQETNLREIVKANISRETKQQFEQVQRANHRKIRNGIY